MAMIKTWARFGETSYIVSLYVLWSAIDGNEFDLITIVGRLFTIYFLLIGMCCLMLATGHKSEGLTLTVHAKKTQSLYYWLVVRIIHFFLRSVRVYEPIETTSNKKITKQTQHNFNWKRRNIERKEIQSALMEAGFIRAVPWILHWFIM